MLGNDGGLAGPPNPERLQMSLVIKQMLQDLTRTKNGPEWAPLRGRLKTSLFMQYEHIYLRCETVHANACERRRRRDGGHREDWMALLPRPDLSLSGSVGSNKPQRTTSSINAEAATVVSNNWLNLCNRQRARLPRRPAQTRPAMTRQSEHCTPFFHNTSS